jgi:hypothetical protein
VTVYADRLQLDTYKVLPDGRIELFNTIEIKK